MTAPLASLVAAIILGIVASIAFNSFAKSWFPMHIGRRSDRTSALVGIAGAFIGLHLGTALGLAPWPGAVYFTAVVGTFLTMWGWHRWM
jgi:hypothetical protein